MTIFSELFKITIYLWLASECIALMHLYKYGYEKVKRSPIIHAMIRLFLLLAIFFAYAALLIVARYMKNESSYILSLGLPVIGIFLGYFLVKFRFESTNQQLGKK